MLYNIFKNLYNLSNKFLKFNKWHIKFDFLLSHKNIIFVFFQNMNSNGSILWIFFSLFSVNFFRRILPEKKIFNMFYPLKKVIQKRPLQCIKKFIKSNSALSYSLLMSSNHSFIRDFWRSDLIWMCNIRFVGKMTSA